jgi:penicillin-binding protein A
MKYSPRWTSSRFASIAAVVLGGAAIVSVFVAMKVTSRGEAIRNEQAQLVTKNEVAEALRGDVPFYRFPAETDVNVTGSGKTRVKVNYAFDSKLQKGMEKLFESYSPDFGAFVAMDAKTGRVISLVSFSRGKRLPDNLALRATFPSASVFKVVTAAAAIESHRVSAETLIPFNGRSHTLYRGQILKSNVTRWTRFMTLKQAFGKSVNTVFGRIGAYTVGSDQMKHYASVFGFNRKIASDIPMQEGKAMIPNDSFGLAESASGYTRQNTMSPMQGALIAATVINNGVMMEPYVVDSMAKPDGSVLYSAKPKVASVAIDPSTATEMRSLMKETVLHGTSQKSFRGFFKKNFTFLNVGGKTGSLTGDNPRGKYDWFVGYADSGPQKIALAALTIHEKQWRVKSSYLARKAIETYFSELLRSTKTVAKNR